MDWLYSYFDEPFLKAGRNEFWTVIRADVFRSSSFQQQRIERFQDICRIHLQSDCHTKCFTAVFIENRQHLVSTTVAQLVMHKINRPNVVGILRP